MKIRRFLRKVTFGEGFSVLERDGNTGERHPGSVFDVRISNLFWIFLLVGSLFAAGCASEPSYRQAFDSSQQIEGNTESIASTPDKTWIASLQVLSQQGFMVRSADRSNDVILADREMADQNDKNVSYQITSTVTLVPLGKDITQVSLAANQTTEFHRKQYVWWHLLWLIPLFPVGSEYTSVVTHRGTVQNPEFYAGFFDNLKKAVQSKTLTKN
ncbi:MULTISPECIES: hypothetical protein [Leptospirillum]|nr:MULTISPECIES: hypothetical protein [Leptospirillum]EAY57886.1 MAG: hypothetical protein UBAL2_82410290 [Leptospirillum rubarum]EIJ75919.1 MAG: Hypothetical protein C75L2_00100002 [Leptospirillum sp. Group II 'C75']MCL5259208.1 hypothetical protein [Nitrospirota bacterium]